MHRVFRGGLAHGDEDGEVEDDAGRDRLLIAPRQHFAVSTEGFGERALLDPHTWLRTNG
jgi:hypothetical protein